MSYVNDSERSWSVAKFKPKSERVFTSKERKKKIKLKLKELIDLYNLPEYMGEMFLFELKNSNDKANQQARDRAKLLGLI